MIDWKIYDFVKSVECLLEKFIYLLFLGRNYVKIIANLEKEQKIELVIKKLHEKR